jgi:phage regulator Rha-like protein
MLLNELYAEIKSLEFQIEDNEKIFDIALLNPNQLGYARQIYRDIKILERKLADLRILINQNSGQG